MQLYLAVTPDKLREAAIYTDHLAHVAYRVGRDGRLTRRDLLVRTRGGLMVLGDQDCGPIRDPAALCRDVWRECGNRGYSGVLADFEESPGSDRTTFLQALGRVLARNGKICLYQWDMENRLNKRWYWSVPPCPAGICGNGWRSASSGLGGGGWPWIFSVCG